MGENLVNPCQEKQILSLYEKLLTATIFLPPQPQEPTAASAAHSVSQSSTVQSSRFRCDTSDHSACLQILSADRCTGDAAYSTLGCEPFRIRQPVTAGYFPHTGHL